MVMKDLASRVVARHLKAVASGVSEQIHESLTAAESSFRQFLHSATGHQWRLKKMDEMTEHGETLITWESDKGALTLVAMAISAKVVSIRLHYNDPAGMPEQPRDGRVPIEKIGDPKAVLGNLLAKYKGKIDWKTATRVAARYLALKVGEQSKAAPKKVDDLHKEVKKDNPGYSDEQAWATAWSIYCKHVDPSGEHCHRPPSGYLKKEV